MVVEKLWNFTLVFSSKIVNNYLETKFKQLDSKLISSLKTTKLVFYNQNRIKLYIPNTSRIFESVSRLNNEIDYFPWQQFCLLRQIKRRTFEFINKNLEFKWNSAVIVSFFLEIIVLRYLRKSIKCFVLKLFTIISKLWENYYKKGFTFRAFVKNTWLTIK